MGYSAQSRSRNAYPGKLDLTYAPQGLWLFDGNLDSTGTTSESMTVARGAVHFFNGVSGDQQSASVDEEDGLEGATTPAPAGIRVAGDLTFEMVYTPVKNDIGAAGTVLFICGGQTGVQADNELYGFLLSNTPSSLNPIFRWEHSAGVRVTVTDPGFDMDPGKPHHIVGRRWTTDAGVTQEGELWVDGALIASVTGQTPADGGTNSPIYMGRNSSGSVAIQIAHLHAIKVIDRKLTDGELLEEFQRTGLGAVLTP